MTVEEFRKFLIEQQHVRMYTHITNIIETIHGLTYENLFRIIEN